MKIFEIYQYMYYRLASWYFRFEKKRNISYGASILVSLSQILILTDVISLLFLELYNQSERQLLMDKFKPYYIVVVLTITFVNDFRYKNKYDIFKEKWQNQNKRNKYIYGILIFLLLIIPLIFIPTLLILFDYSK